MPRAALSELTAFIAIADQRSFRAAARAPPIFLKLCVSGPLGDS